MGCRGRNAAVRRPRNRRLGIHQTIVVVVVRNERGRQSVRNSIEVAIADERIQVSLIGDPVVIPVVWIDAAIGGLDLVRARHEVAVLEKSSLYMYATQSGKFASG